MKLKSRKDRKVTYVDVGSMSSKQVKKYLERVKKAIETVDVPSKSK